MAFMRASISNEPETKTINDLDYLDYDGEILTDLLDEMDDDELENMEWLCDRSD